MTTRFRFKLKGGYVIGAICFPTEVGNVTVGAVGATKAEALIRAATIAQRITDDPVMRALMPPQALVAIAAAKALSAAARRGPKALRSLWGSIRGEGKKRLAVALKNEMGALYFGKKSEVRQPNRGAWQHWEDYADDNQGDDEEDVYAEIDELGRRRKKRKRKSKRYAPERSEREPELPADAPQADNEEPEDVDAESEDGEP